MSEIDKILDKLSQYRNDMTNDYINPATAKARLYKLISDSIIGNYSGSDLVLLSNQRRQRTALDRLFNIKEDN